MARLCEFRFLTAPGHGEQAQLTQPSHLSPCTLGLFERMAFFGTRTRSQFELVILNWVTRFAPPQILQTKPWTLYRAKLNVLELERILFICDGARKCSFYQMQSFALRLAHKFHVIKKLHVSRLQEQFYSHLILVRRIVAIHMSHKTQATGIMNENTLPLPGQLIRKLCTTETVQKRRVVLFDACLSVF